ncbi:MAG: FecR domain-containing protein [Gemmatimonadetes bacterium]|nr:FecR domain-containing protein [Gemmatimonadota bacterium]
MSDSDMDGIIFRHLQGDTTPEEERSLQVWRSAHPVHEEQFEELQRLWSARKYLLPKLYTEPAYTAEQLLRRGRRSDRNSLLSRSGGVLGSVVRSRGGRFAAAAAAVILVAIFGGDWKARADRGIVEIVTDPSETSSARLPDGTVVRLAPASRLRYVDGRDVRQAWLNGRGYFAVEPADGKPFRVRTSSGDVLVRGTRFDIESRNRELLRVVVADGKVRVSVGDEEVDLESGEMSESKNGGPPKVSRIPQVHRHLQWLGSFVAFKSTPLASVADELEQRFGMRVEILAPELARHEITIWSTNKGPREIISAVCAAIDAHCVIGDTLATIQP